MSSNKFEDFQVIGCSVRGPGHVEDGIPNQDSLTITEFSDSKFAIAISDGLGSSGFSEEGSAVATEETCQSLENHLNSLETIDEETVDEIFRDSFDKARNAIHELAEEKNEPLCEFDSTIVAVIGGPFGVAGAMVGDGGIIYQNDTEYELMVEREMAVEDLSASHLTHSVVDNEWPCYRYGLVEECEGVILFSDGIEEFVWGGLDSVRPSFFDGAFKIAREIPDQIEAKNKLKGLLSTNKFERLSDDKTVAVVDLER